MHAIARSEIPEAPSLPEPSLCMIKNSSCAAACCLHKGFPAALMVPPPPADHILLETSLHRITREHTQNTMKGSTLTPQSRSYVTPNLGSGVWPIWHASLLVPWSLCDARPPPASLHHRGSTHPRGFPSPRRSQRHASDLGCRRRPSVDLGHYGPAVLSKCMSHAPR